MKIKLLLFAQFREILGEEKEMDIRYGETAGDVLKRVFEHPELKELKALSVRCAVNEDFCGLGHVLHDRDTLAIIPPVAGG